MDTKQERELLQQLETQADNFLFMGQIDKVFASFRKALEIQTQSTGSGSRETLRLLSRQIFKLVKKATGFTERGKPKTSIRLLKRAKTYLMQSRHHEELSSEKVAICCKVAFALMKLDESETAMRQIDKAMRIAKTPRARAEAHLQLAMLLSSIGRHEEALSYATIASQQASEDVRRCQRSGHRDLKGYSLLAVAYHHMAIENMYLGQEEESALWQRKAQQIIEASGDTRHVKSPQSLSISVRGPSLEKSYRAQSAQTTSRKSLPRYSSFEAQDLEASQADYAAELQALAKHINVNYDSTAQAMEVYKRKSDPRFRRQCGVCKTVEVRKGDEAIESVEFAGLPVLSREESISSAGSNYTAPIPTSPFPLIGSQTERDLGEQALVVILCEYCLSLNEHSQYSAYQYCRLCFHCIHICKCNQKKQAKNKTV